MSLADNFIDVDNAKYLALKVNAIMKEHFKNLGIYFIDFCLMITSDGKRIYGEFSQECMRADKIVDGKPESLTKDVWRAGGSTPDKSLVLSKYKELSEYIVKYTHHLVNKKMKELSEI